MVRVIVTNKQCWKVRWPLVPERMQYTGIPLLRSMNCLLNGRQIPVTGDFESTTVKELEVDVDWNAEWCWSRSVADIFGQVLVMNSWAASSTRCTSGFPSRSNPKA